MKTLRPTSLLVLVSVTSLLYGQVSMHHTDMEQILKQLQAELAGMFKARVAVTIVEKTGKTYSETIEEYHDGSAGIHSLHHLQSGKSIFYFDRLKKKIVVLANSANESCNIRALEDVENDSLHMFTRVGNKIYFGPTAIIMNLNIKIYEKVTENRVMIRGIEAYQYEFKVPGKVETYQVYYPYERWSVHVLAQGERPPFPLRVEVTRPDIVSIFDFYQVQDLTHKELFKTGDKLQLPFYNNCRLPEHLDMKMPELGSQISFVSGLSDGTGLDLGFFTAKEWFDRQQDLTRCDEMGNPSVITDGQHGLVYTLGDTCVAEPLIDDAISGHADRLTQLLSPTTCAGAIALNALAMEDKYYIGEGVERGIPVDVWQTSEQGNSSRLARFYISKPDVIMSINDQSERQLPVRVVVRDRVTDTLGTTNDVVTDVAIFDYFSTENAVEFSKNFNVEDCQGSYQYFEIGFQSTQAFDVDLFRASNAVEQLTMAIRQALLKETGISVLRLPYIKVEVQDNRWVLATVKLLAPPPYLTSFIGRPQKYPKPKRQAEHSETDEGCAKLCAADQSCVTMLLCKNDCVLLETTDDTQWGPNESSTSYCTAYDKSETVGKFVYKTEDEIIGFLTEAVNNGSKAFRFSATWEHEKTSQFDAKYLQAHLNLFESDAPYELQLPSKRLKSAHPGSHEITDVASAGECYRECVRDNEIACASFSVCASTGSCVLSALNINSGSQHDSDQENATQAASADCAVYSVSYLGQFERFAGHTRVAGAPASDVAATAGGCAFMCRQKRYDELVGGCNGFDFCPMQRRCYFYDTHYSWEVAPGGEGGSSNNSSSGGGGGGDDSAGPGGNADNATALEPRSGCDHYALRFSADFTALGKRRLDEAVVTGTDKVADVSMDECARRCSELSDGRCTSLAYCGDHRICHLYSVTLEELSDLSKSSADPHCTIYMRNLDVADIIRPKRQEEKTRETLIKGMGNGAFATLLVIMTIVGLIIGLLGYTYQERLRALVARNLRPSGASNNPPMSFGYNRHADEASA